MDERCRFSCKMVKHCLELRLIKLITFVLIETKKILNEIQLEKWFHQSSLFLISLLRSSSVWLYNIRCYFEDFVNKMCRKCEAWMRLFCTCVFYSVRCSAAANGQCQMTHRHRLLLWAFQGKIECINIVNTKKTSFQSNKIVLNSSIHHYLKKKNRQMNCNRNKCRCKSSKYFDYAQKSTHFFCTSFKFNANFYENFFCFFLFRLKNIRCL